MSEENKSINTEASSNDENAQENSENIIVKESNESKTNNLDDLVDSATNKNKKKVKCVRCDSYILQPNSCTFIKTEETFEGTIFYPIFFIW